MRASVESWPALAARDFDGARAVDRAGEHVVSLRLVDGHRLPGDRRLVHLRHATLDPAVDGHLLARTHGHEVARPHLVDRHAHLDAVSQDRGLARRDGHQCPDGTAGAFEAVPLEVLRQREEEHHRCRFEVVPQEDRAQHGHEHQDVHVDVERADGVPGAAPGRNAAGHERRQEARDRQRLPRAGPLRHRSDPEQGAGRREKPDAHVTSRPRGARSRPVTLGRRRLRGRQADTADRRGDRFAADERRVEADTHAALHQVGRPVFDARHAREALADQAHLVLAAQSLDVEADVLGHGHGRANLLAHGRGHRRPPGRMTAADAW